MNKLSISAKPCEPLPYDGPDGTADVVRSQFKIPVGASAGVIAGGGTVRLHVRDHDKGLANSIRDGLERADGRTLVVMDTDFNHDPAMIPQMVDLLRYYDLVIGSRFVMRGGMEDIMRYYASFLYNFFIRLLLAWRNDWRILEVPVFYILRRHGDSKTGFLDIFREYTAAVIKLRLFGL